MAEHPARQDPRPTAASMLHLQPPAIPHGGTSKWQTSGRTLGAAMHPATAELAIHVAAQSQRTETSGAYDQDKVVYLGKWEEMPAQLNKLHADSHAIFVSLQSLYKSQLRALMLPQPQLHLARSTLLGASLPSFAPQAPLSSSTFGFRNSLLGDDALKPGPDQVIYYRRIADEYGARLVEVTRDADIDPATRLHHASLLRVFSLASTLYVPSDGAGQSLVGEELLDWYNAFGDPDGVGQLADDVGRVIAIGDAWEHEAYQDLVIRSILRGMLRDFAVPLLQALEPHPQSAVSTFAQILIDGLDSMPRSTQVSSYPNEALFAAAHQTWRAEFSAQVATHQRGRSSGWLDFKRLPKQTDQDMRDDAKAWESFFATVVDLMAGVEARVLEECEDWKTAVAAWGVLIEPRIKREDLAEVVERATERLPIDMTITEEDIQRHLLSGEITKSLVRCNDLDTWLSAHLTDLLDKMSLVDDDEEMFELPLRDYLLMSYADKLQANPRYWSIACDYLATCDESQGKGRMRSIVRRVACDDVERTEEVLQICAQHRLEDETREVCRTAARTLLASGKFGEAIAFCIRSEDNRLLGVIADEVLEVYVRQNPDAFSDAVATIPPTLLEPPADQRLLFLSRFREFLQAFRDDHHLAAQILVGLFQSGLVPHRFRAVLLMDSLQLLESEDVLFSVQDTFELMRHMEEITSGATHHPELWLETLYEITKRSVAKEEDDSRALPSRKEQERQRQERIAGMLDALKALDAFKLAAVRNISRASLHSMS